MDLLTVTITLAGGGGVLGGLYALLKLRPEAGQITVSAAQGAIIVQTGVIENLQKEITRLSQHHTELEMENTAQQRSIDESQATVARLRLTVEFLQRDLDRHGRMSELARRRSHILAKAFSSLELKVDGLIDEMNRHNVPVPPEYQPAKLRAEVREQLDEVAELERQVTYDAVLVKAPGNPDTEGDETV